MLPNYIERMKSNNKKLILVKGNHDKLEEEAYYNLGFDKVYSEPVYLKYCTLSHEPIENADRLNFHGHTHDKEPQDFNSVYNNNKFYVNCCLDYRKTFLEIADDILEGVL
jgi:calcineurin-like phosphoesterase family protein